MSVNLPPPATLHEVDGIRLACTAAQIKYANRNDLALFEISPGSTCAAVFTQNAFCAAPVTLAKRHLAQTAPRYLLINSGNANAGTGDRGLQDATACCAALAEQGGCSPNQVLPFSTGVIGAYLPVDKICGAIPALQEKLAPGNWQAVAEAIMTTDTVAKTASVQFEVKGKTVTVTGIAKGSGMIRPDMATMLAFIATDAKVDQMDLQNWLSRAVEFSFNRITVDGDTSTNDACVLSASGRSGVHIAPYSDAMHSFHEALDKVCSQLAQAIIRDGEGASKFITIQAEGGANRRECLDVAYTIAHSPLVKTAFFANDPNWGRILAAVGRAGLDNLNLQKVQIYLNDICIVRDGGCAPEYTEEQGQQVMAQTDINVRVLLGRGDHHDRVWTCDLSYDYVKINAEYRT